MNASFTILAIGVIIFLAHWFSGIFDRKGIPDVLLLMLVGILFGPILNMVNPMILELLGHVYLVNPVIILFEGE
jgi:Kef-type K+ transport system membrane component KefB